MSIVTNRFWIKNSQVGSDEDNSTEFKNHRSISEEEVSKQSMKISPISNAICGFLNQGTGGKILLGIHDSGRVDGICLTPTQMDHCNASVEDTLNRFNPPVPKGAVQVRFVPVLPEDHPNPREFMRGRREKVVELREMVNEDDRDRKHQLRKPVGKCWCDKESENLENSGEIIPDWVVEIEILQQSGLTLELEDKLSDIPGVECCLQYENEQQIAYLRVDAATRKMFPFDTSRHVNEVVINHYQPIVDRLKREIDEKLEKLGYPSRIENSLVDNHEGLKKEPGLVIQPNVIRPLS